MDRRTALKYIAGLFAIPLARFFPDRKLDGIIPAEIEVEVHRPSIVWEEVSQTLLDITDIRFWTTKCCNTDMNIHFMTPPEGWTHESYCICGALYCSTLRGEKTLQIIEYRKEYV